MINSKKYGMTIALYLTMLIVENYNSL